MLPRASGLVVALGALVAHAQAQSGFMVIPDSPDRTAMQSECGPSDRQAAVRCCSDTVIVGWPQNVGCSVWSASELTSQIGALSVPEARESNGCAEAATHEQAVAICAAEGARDAPVYRGRGEQRLLHWHRLRTQRPLCLDQLSL